MKKVKKKIAKKAYSIVKTNDYKCDIKWSVEDKAYVVSFPDLPGCVTHGDTLEEAIKNSKIAKGLYLESLREHGLPAPERLADKVYAGEIAVRIPPDLHKEVAIRAHYKGISMSQYIEEKLKH